MQQIYLVIQQLKMPTPSSDKTVKSTQFQKRASKILNTHIKIRNIVDHMKKETKKDWVVS